jgi:hypothetical protein
MIQKIFGSPIIILKIDDVEQIFPIWLYDDIIDHLMESGNRFVNHPYTKGGKICTTDLTHSVNKIKINAIQPLINFLQKIGLKYSYLFTDNLVDNLKFNNSWINLTFEGCEIKNHYDKYENTDFKSLITLFYPKVPPRSSNLVFIHNSKYGQWASNCEEINTVKIEIEQGNIIIFDNTILHAVDAHKSSEPRLCIAVEFNFSTD